MGSRRHHGRARRRREGSDERKRKKKTMMTMMMAVRREAGGAAAVTGTRKWGNQWLLAAAPAAAYIRNERNRNDISFKIVARKRLFGSKRKKHRKNPRNLDCQKTTLETLVGCPRWFHSATAGS